MRATLRLLATAQKAKFLTPGAPTGLTGLFTHPAPRSALIYLYSKTLDRLAKLPEESVYRTATEALTKQRLQIVQSVVPKGFEAWQKKVAETVKAHPEVFAAGGGYDKGRNVAETFGGKTFVSSSARKTFDDRTTEWDGEVVVSNLEGTRTDAEKTADLKGLEEERPLEETKRVELDEEPPLTAEQIAGIENQIGAGLIEEIIQVAEAELKLVDVMEQAKVWEDLEEKPVEGQWTYFERGAHAGS